MQHPFVPDHLRDPADLIATMPEWGARLIAPVRALIDCALHDFVARRERLSVGAWLGAATQEMVWDTNQTLFWSSLDDLLREAGAYVDRGFYDLKVRVAVSTFAQDRRRLEALRDRFGSRISLAIDGNGQWAASDALGHLRALARFDLAYAEQPVPAGDWEAVRILAAESPIPIMLDESVFTALSTSEVVKASGM